MKKLKKNCILFICLTAVLSSLLLSACGAKCEHSYIGKITTKATCISEGIKTYTCTICQESYDEILPVTETHNYKSEVTKEADCSAEGEKSFTCIDCDHSYTETIPQSDNHDYESKVTVKATCKKVGEETKKCKLCGKVETAEIPTVDHVFNDGKVTKKATLYDTGIKQFSCKECGYKKEETIPVIVLADTPYVDGIYKCPDDIPEGEYILISDAHDGYFAIAADPMGNDIIDNENFGHVAHTNVLKGTYLELSKCIAVPYSDDIAFNIVDNGYITGIYKVGKDIPAGSYKLTAISGGYYSIHNKPNGSILSNDYFDDGTCYITLKDGQYVCFSSVRIEEN